MFATMVILGIGLFQRKEKANAFMRWRIYIQALAFILFAFILWMHK
jgi:hypothetical protein